MINHSLYISIIIILLIVLLFKLYIESDKNTTYLKKQKSNFNPYYNNNDFDYLDNNNNKYTANNHKYEKMLEDMNKDTMKKINKAVEQGYIEGFQAMNVEIKEKMDGTSNINNFYKHENDSNPNYNYNSNSKSIYNSTTKNKNKSNDNIISYLNRDNSEKIMLFYKPSCPYCSDFMPTWYKIVNNLSNNVLYEEINCEKENKKANEYQITSVPTIILLVNNEKKMYMGDRNYKDIMQFLKYNGVNLVERTFEEFDTTGYENDSDDKIVPNTSICQDVTFNTETDIAQDQYMFQIFNTDGQYGYAEGGYNPGKLMTPFTAAYSTIDSYLTSLPEGANLNDCANKYADQIRSFGLCDKEQLNNVLQYQKDVADGSATILIKGTDYSSNNDVIKAVKNACSL
jgi:thiol-disulfide isomerase/thioredoxin